MQRTETKAKPCPITKLFYPDRSEMNEMNKFLSMSMMRGRMEACEDIKPAKTCKKLKKKGKCSIEKFAKDCKKTCDLCDDQTDNCDDTLHQLQCLSKD